jgi:hypothetical protein
MPYITHPGTLTLKHGTRTAVVEHVTHVRGSFSGPQRPEDTYFTVSGEDTTTPRSVFCPPATLTLDESRTIAENWVLGL